MILLHSFHVGTLYLRVHELKPSKRIKSVSKDNKRVIRNLKQQP